MRAHILSLMQQNHISCEQRCIEMDQIAHIQNIFFCNALHPMKAVVRFQGRTMQQQPYLDLFNSLKLSQID